MRFDSLLQGNDAHIGIQCRQRGARGFNFRRADRIGAVENLALQVGEVDLVRVGEGEFSDAAGGEVERRGATQAAGADDERVRRAQPLLALDAYFIEQDMAAVAEELLVVQWAENLDSRFRGNDDIALTQKFLSLISPPAWSARLKASGL